MHAKFFVGGSRADRYSSVTSNGHAHYAHEPGLIVSHPRRVTGKCPGRPAEGGMRRSCERISRQGLEGSFYEFYQTPARNDRRSFPVDSGEQSFSRTDAPDNANHLGRSNDAAEIANLDSNGHLGTSCSNISLVDGIS